MHQQPPPPEISDAPEQLLPELYLSEHTADNSISPQTNNQQPNISPPLIFRATEQQLIELDHSEPTAKNSNFPKTAA